MEATRCEDEFDDDAAAYIPADSLHNNRMQFAQTAHFMEYDAYAYSQKKEETW